MQDEFRRLFVNFMSFIISYKNVGFAVRKSSMTWLCACNPSGTSTRYGQTISNWDDL